MLKFLVILMVSFTIIEAAHLNYHYQQEVIDSYVHDWSCLVRDNRAFTAFRGRYLGYLGYPGKILTEISKPLYHITKRNKTPKGA